MSRPAAFFTDAVRQLHAWYRDNARDLPWRRTKDPYAIWVSEVMLQQTRVATVIPYYERWLARFPDPAALAAAPEDVVLKCWEGLGYYSRARNLQRAAQAVVREHEGRVPLDPQAFQALPGVGDYTAAAVLSIAADRDMAAVDGNVKRVLARWSALDAAIDSTEGERAIRNFARDLLPPGRAAVHNQALMELGALVCTPRSPTCDTCPVATSCRAWAAGRHNELPNRKPRRKVPHVGVAIGIVLHEGRFFVDRRPDDGMLAGLWEFPGGKLEGDESPLEALARELWEEFRMRAAPEARLDPVRHAYTHLRVTLHPFVCRLVDMHPDRGEGRPWRWVAPDELTDLAMPTANRRVLELLERYLARLS